MTSLFQIGVLGLLRQVLGFDSIEPRQPVGQDREFRVQEHLGGLVEPFAPDAETIRICERVLSYAPGPTLYARVDGVATARGFVLLELEVIEPSLFFVHAPAAAARLAIRL